MELTTKDLKDCIFTIRGQQVMVDVDLAQLYGVQTKRLNEQVRRNTQRFPEDFMFQLSVSELGKLVANCDRLSNMKHSASLPYVFTEQGVAMFATALGCFALLRKNHA